MPDALEVDVLLPEIDREFLEEKGYVYTITRVGADVHVVIVGLELPAAYMPSKVDLLIIVPAGYPNANLDMFWTFPDVTLANGTCPDRCQHRQAYGDRTWQRWSRHFPNPWRQGIDNLRTFLTAVRKELAKGI